MEWGQRLQVTGYLPSPLWRDIVRCWLNRLLISLPAPCDWPSPMTPLTLEVLIDSLRVTPSPPSVAFLNSNGKTTARSMATGNPRWRPRIMTAQTMSLDSGDSAPENE